jgi:hypothetical protein
MIVFKGLSCERLISLQSKRISMNQFRSKQYKKFETWQKVIFWIGILSFINLTYWIVRLVLYLVLQDQPLSKRVDAYALQTYVFGWINIVVIVILIIVLVTIFTAFGVAALMALSLQP